MSEVREFNGRRTKADKGCEAEGLEAEILVIKHRKECSGSDCVEENKPSLSSSQVERATKALDPLFIHTNVLPAFNSALDQTLIADLPLCLDPIACIRADAEYVYSIVQALSTSPQNIEIHHANFLGDTMIYRRLILYVFAHLLFCSSNQKLLDQFKETLQQWKAWDGLTIIKNHQLIKDYLWDVFQQGLTAEASSTLHSEETFRKLVALDAIGICAHLKVWVTDDNKYQDLLTQRDQIAQSLVNLLQARLDFPMEPQYKPRHVKALLKLCRASGLYPESLALKGIEMERHPVDNGGYGDVYKGQLHGRKIAIKALKVYQSSNLARLLKDFLSEAVLWRQLSHPNVLPFYGIYQPDDSLPRLCLTSPWMENGNAVEFLNRHPETQCVHLVSDMALGLEYLHGLQPGVVHGDLKGANVLITQSGRACLADFGLAIAIDSNTMTVAQNSTVRSGGTVRWQAPELFNPTGCQQNTTCSDIYAFACVCYEMFSSQVPFYELRQDYSIIIPVMEGKRPDFPSGDLSQTRGLNTDIWDLIQACWAQDPTRRPIVKQVVERLKSLPHRSVDNRPLDDFHFPIQAFYGRNEHLFSTIVAVDQNFPIPGPTTFEQVPLASALAAEQAPLASDLLPSEQTSVMSRYATVTQIPLIKQALLTSTPAPPTQTLVARAPATLEREPLVSTPSAAEKSLLSSIPAEQTPSASVLATVEQASIVSALSTVDQAPLTSALTVGHTSPASGPGSTEETPLASVPAITEQVSEAFNEGSIFNVVIFGEAGAGKSSVVNMIAGRQVVQPSINKAGYPSQTKPHVVNLDGTPIKLWVTAGLNEEDNGTPSAKHSIINLYKLVKRLEDGISLLVYCVRGPEIKNSITRNYRLFHHGLCQQKVPIVLVVTGLEGEHPMDAWWEMNQAVFQKQQLVFSGQACVTATKGQFKAGAYAFEKEYEESKTKVQKLIGECSRTVQRKIKPSHWVMDTFKNTINIVTRMLHVPLLGLNFSLHDALMEYGGFSDEQAEEIVYEVETGKTADDEEQDLWSDIYHWVQS